MRVVVVARHHLRALHGVTRRGVAWRYATLLDVTIARHKISPERVRRNAAYGWRRRRYSGRYRRYRRYSKCRRCRRDCRSPTSRADPAPSIPCADRRPPPPCCKSGSDRLAPRRRRCLSHLARLGASRNVCNVWNVCNVCNVCVTSLAWAHHVITSRHHVITSPHSPGRIMAHVTARHGELPRVTRHRAWPRQRSERVYYPRVTPVLSRTLRDVTQRYATLRDVRRRVLSSSEAEAVCSRWKPIESFSSSRCVE